MRESFMHHTKTSHVWQYLEAIWPLHQLSCDRLALIALPFLYSFVTSKLYIVAMRVSTFAYVSMWTTIICAIWKLYTTSSRYSTSISTTYASWIWFLTSTRSIRWSMKCSSLARYEKHHKPKFWNNFWPLIRWSKEWLRNHYKMLVVIVIIP